MNLVQFNIDVDPGVKKAIRRDSVDFDVTHGVIANAIFEDFFSRNAPAKRQRLYKKMQRKNGARKTA